MLRVRRSKQDCFRRAIRAPGAATLGGTLDDTTWAGPLAAVQGAVSGFLTSLGNHGRFDQILQDSLQVPLRTRLSVTTTAAVGAVPGVAELKPIASLSLTGHTLNEFKASVILVTSSEVLKIAAGASGFFGRELLRSVALSTDQKFVSILTSGLATISSTGGTAVSIRTDLQTALSPR